MGLKVFLVASALLFCFAAAYEMEGDVMVLGDKDFPQVLVDNPYILIEFYAPW